MLYSFNRYCLRQDEGAWIPCPFGVQISGTDLTAIYPRACLKIHSRHLHVPLRGIFGPNSVSVAHYASFIGAKSPTKCDAQLTESNFQTRPRPYGCICHQVVL
ncbi:MAG: DUF6783 domain-containing protein [Enterocloster aldenensis]